MRRRHAQRLDSIATAEEFYRLLFALVADLDDTHSWLQNYHPPFPASGPGLTTDLFEDRPFILAVKTNSPAAAAGIKAGAEILAVDGLTVAAKMEQLRASLRGFSSQRAFRRAACRHLLAGESGTLVNVKLRSPEGRVDSFTLQRSYSLGDAPPPPSPIPVTRQRFVHYGRLDSSLGYIQIASFNAREELSTEFDRALEFLKTAPALILDIRDNPGGFGAQYIVGRLLPKPTLCAISYLKSGPALHDLERREETLTPTGPWQYRGPIALLVNDVTGSAADLFACYLRSAHRVVTLGSTTHGNLAGVAAFAVLPCGLIVRISNGYVCDAADKPIEGRGNEPDVTLQPTIGDFLAGRDPVFERAVTVLQEQLAREKRRP